MFHSFEMPIIYRRELLMHGSTGAVEKLEGVVQVAKCVLEKENIRVVVQVT